MEELGKLARERDRAWLYLIGLINAGKGLAGVRVPLVDGTLYPGETRAATGADGD